MTPFPRIDPLVQLVQVVVHVLGRVGDELVNDFLVVRLVSLVQRGLKYFALHIVLYSLLIVASLLQSLEQQSVVGAQHEHGVEPPFRKEVALIVVDHIVALFHLILHLIHHLVLIYLVALGLLVVLQIEIVLSGDLVDAQIVEAGCLRELFGQKSFACAGRSRDQNVWSVWMRFSHYATTTTTKLQKFEEKNLFIKFFLVV